MVCLAPHAPHTVGRPSVAATTSSNPAAGIPQPAATGYCSHRLSTTTTSGHRLLQPQALHNHLGLQAARRILKPDAYRYPGRRRRPQASHVQPQARNCSCASKNYLRMKITWEQPQSRRRCARSPRRRLREQKVTRKAQRTSSFAWRSSTASCFRLKSPAHNFLPKSLIPQTIFYPKHLSRTHFSTQNTYPANTFYPKHLSRKHIFYLKHLSRKHFFTENTNPANTFC